MEYDYLIRITHSFDVARAVCLLFAERAQKVAVFEHLDQARIHIHIAIQGCEVSSKRLRQQAALTGLNVKGNKYASFKTWDKNERALVYCTKGQYRPLYLKGWTEADADRWISLYERNPPDISPHHTLYNECFDDGDQDNTDYYYYTRQNPIIVGEGREQRIIENHKFQWVKHQAKTFVFNHNQRIWDMGALARYRMLVFTYCYRHEVPMDSDWNRRF